MKNLKFGKAFLNRELRVNKHAKSEAEKALKMLGKIANVHNSCTGESPATDKPDEGKSRPSGSDA